MPGTPFLPRGQDGTAPAPRRVVPAAFGPLAEAQFNYPCQMCVDPEGEAIYVTDRENHCIRKITLSNGYVSTFAGTPKSSGYVNGPADAAKFNKPVGLAITAEGNLYIGDSENYAIRRIAIE